jgi:O-antigen/teichoic acid export membrane protein
MPMKKILTRLDWSYFYALLGEGTLALTFALYIILARKLGPEEYGIFAAAAALGGILSLFITLGFPTLLTREVAANPLEGSKLTVQFLFIEGLSALLVLCALLPIARILGFEGRGLIICYLVILAEICRSAKTTIRSVLRGKGWFRSETISVALERSVVAILAIAVLWLSGNLILVLVTLILLRIIDILGLLYYLSRKVSIWSPVNLNRIQQSFRRSLPFAVTGILVIIYYQIDLIMLKALAPTEQVGFYSVAFRVMEIFSALPRVIFAVVFTRFAQCYVNEPKKLPKEIYKATRLLVMVVVPILVVAGFIQENLVEALYGETFFPATQSLAILLPTISMSMFGGLVAQALNATANEKCLPFIGATTVMINLGSNAILIPLMGPVGAAIATLLSELVQFVMSLSCMKLVEGKRVKKYLGFMAVISLLITALPSLILKGLSP